MSSSCASRPLDLVSLTVLAVCVRTLEAFVFPILVLVLIAFPDSDSEEDEPQFYLANESHGRMQHSAYHANHNLSLLALTVNINKGRIQARTDRKVNGIL